MTRPKAPDQLAKRGPKPKIGPKKRTWLNKIYDEWKVAEGRNTGSEFYRRLTQLWFQTFGYDLPFNDDPVGIVEIESRPRSIDSRLDGGGGDMPLMGSGAGPPGERGRAGGMGIVVVGLTQSKRWTYMRYGPVAPGRSAGRNIERIWMTVCPKIHRVES